VFIEGEELSFFQYAVVTNGPKGAKMTVKITYASAGIAILTFDENHYT
jgi:hypothetical protein